MIQLQLPSLLLRDAATDISDISILYVFQRRHLFMQHI